MKPRFLIVRGNDMDVIPNWLIHSMAYLALLGVGFIFYLIGLCLRG